jgi:hypothetical protein
MLFDNFKEENIREVVYYEINEKGETIVSPNRAFNFIRGNIIQLQEPFLLSTMGFYKEYKGVKNHENIFLPKGFSMRVESIMGWYNKRISFSPLLRYNKKVETDLKTRKFNTNFSDIHGLKFAVFKDDETFMRKRKIDTLFST